jgi:UDP-N-acetylglucosamine diphosphorylase/glucosamine-1-phosphate N-acetyltransferase
MTANTAVILAAGEGQRMHPLTHNRPKVMLPVAGKPILEHLLIAMTKAGIKKFVLVVGYHDEQIRNYFKDGSAWNMRIHYQNQRKQLGTADAVRMVKDFITGDFLVANGDIMVKAQDVINLVNLTGNVMSVIELTDVSGLGVVEVNKGNITHIYEKSANPPSHLANAGVYAFTNDIFQAIEQTTQSPRGEFELTDSIQLLINAGKTVTCNTISQWLDLSYPWQLLNANENILPSLDPQNEGEIEPGAVIKGPVSVGRGTLIRSGSYIIGPVIIGCNCDIGPNCYIRPCTTIGDKCHVGAAVEVKNSIIMSGTKIPHFNYVGDSIIGENCNLGAGTKIANLRLDKLNVVISGKDTGRRKLGAIIGDKVETGINSSINVGTLIGDNTFIGPGALAKGVIKPGAKVF